MKDEKAIAVEREHEPFANPLHAAHGLAVQGSNRRFDRAEDERAEQVDALEPVADDMARQRLQVNDDVGEFRQLFLQPLDDLLARPLMIVVQMEDDRVERQAFVAAHGTTAADVLEAVEEPVETRPDGVRFLRVARQRVGAFVGGAERAGTALGRKIFAEGLRRTPPRAFSNRVGELELIGAENLMHGVCRSAEAVAPW